MMLRSFFQDCHLHRDARVADDCLKLVGRRSGPEPVDKVAEILAQLNNCLHAVRLWDSGGQR